MNEIKRFRFNDLLARLFGLEQMPPAPVLGMEVLPTFQVEEPGPEHRFSAAWRLCGGYATAPAGAGVKSTIALRNPAESNVIGVVEEFSVITGALEILFGLFDAAGTAVTTTGFRDSRLGVTARRPTLQLTQNGVASLPGPPLGGEIYSPDKSTVSFVVAPGLAFVLECQTVNTAILASLVWRERSVTTEELNA